MFNENFAKKVRTCSRFPFPETWSLNSLLWTLLYNVGNGLYRVFTLQIWLFLSRKTIQLKKYFFRSLNGELYDTFSLIKVAGDICPYCFPSSAAPGHNKYWHKTFTSNHMKTNKAFLFLILATWSYFRRRASYMNCENLASSSKFRQIKFRL
jgi:hypothetical protein